MKKETVRVTLKAADMPPATPSATVPGVAPAPAVRPPTPTAPPVPTAPPAPTLGGAPRPPAPAPTIPLKTPGTPIPAPAPTIKLATVNAPVGAPTVQLKPGGAPTLPGTGGTPTLPKATVQLQPPTQPLTAAGPSASQMATLQVDDEYESEAGEGLGKALAIVGFVAALVVLGLQLKVAGTWISAEDNPRSGEWSQLFSSES